MAMSDAGYISEKLLEKFLKEIIFRYPEIASQVLVPNDEDDRSHDTKWFQRVMKFRINRNNARKAEDKCVSNSSILMNGAHHPRELVSI